MQETTRVRVEAIIQKELSPNGRLLWSGKPRGGIQLRPFDAFIIPFSIMWGGFAFFWEYSVPTKGAPFFFTLWGIPFVLMGLYFIFGRFIFDAKQRENTYYGLTNGRIIIVSGLFSRNSKTLSLRTLSDISLRQSSNGSSGTISFGPLNPMTSWLGGGFAWPGIPTGSNFELIENVKDVYDKILAAQKEV